MNFGNQGVGTTSGAQPLTLSNGNGTALTGISVGSRARMPVTSARRTTAGRRWRELELHDQRDLHADGGGIASGDAHSDRQRGHADQQPDGNWHGYHGSDDADHFSVERMRRCRER